MAKSIATVSGTALIPGVSRNGRLYTREAIAKAVARAQDRIAGGDPLTMLTHHAAGDDSTAITGRVTAMSLAEDGSARYTATLADTPTGHTIASLLSTDRGAEPFLKGVSIRGTWAGTVRRVRGSDGQHVETADDLEIDGLDYTRSPGVPGAGVERFAWAKDGANETTERVAIYESVQEARVAITEETAPTRITEGQSAAIREAARAVLPVREAHQLDNGTCVTCATEAKDPQKPYGDVTYADPGYQKDGQKRYPLDTEQHIRAAWSFINQAKNAGLYTAAQLKRIKGRIKAALKKIGAKVTAEGWIIDPAVRISESVAEWYGADSSTAGSYSISASNGPTNICISSYCVDPADLEEILRAACEGACKALATLDIDVPGAGDTDDPDGDADDLATRLAAAIKGESGEPLDTLIHEARTAAGLTPPDPAPTPDAAHPQETEAPAVSETTTTQEAAGAPAAAPASTSIPADALKAAVDKAIADRKAAKKARKAARAGTTETVAPAAPVTETDDERIARIVNERVQAGLAEHGLAETEEQRIARMVEERMVAERLRITAAGGGPPRKGLEAGGEVNEAAGQRAADGLNPTTGMPAEWGSKPLHEMSQEEFDQRTGPAVVRHVLGARAELLS